MESPVSWTFTAESTGKGEGVIIMKATIPSPWHMYSQEKTEGPFPTSFTFNESGNYTLTGDIEELSKIKVIFDKGFNIDVKTFSDSAIFRQKIKFTGKEAFSVTGAVEFMVCDDENCMPPKTVEFETIIQPLSDSYQKLSSSSGNDRLLTFFIIAFFAGLAGVLTPCVFPMIPMTVSFFMRGGSRASGIGKGLFYGLSIILIYTSIGIIVALTSSGADLASRMSTHWIPNIIFFTLFIAFALSFLGLFDITLPSGLAGSVDKQALKGGLFGIFFMALTLVVVSFSCTGPIVGAILVESAGGLAIKPILGMFGFALAFALPFTFLAIFPSYLSKLPKSGGWMVTIKGIMGLILLAFSLKFVSAVDQAYHLNILSRNAFIAIWIVISFIMGFYLLGKIRFMHDSPVETTGPFRLLFAISAFSFAVSLIPGLFGAPLKGLSSLLPPAESKQYFQIQGSSTYLPDINSDLCGTPRYADFLHLPHGLSGYFDYAQGLACAKNKNMPVLLDFKGHFCSNCKKMEAEVLSDPEILSIISSELIMTALYTDDRTTLPENEWIRTEPDGKVKKTMGQVNLDLQINRYNTNTLPAYIIVDHNGDILSGPIGYSPDKETFRKFLNDGITAFKTK